MIAAVIAIVSLLVLSVLMSTMQQQRLLRLVEEEQRSSLDADNRMVTELYHANHYLRTHFQPRQALNRNVLFGVVDGHLVLLKYKQGELRLGLPSTFRAQDNSYDQCVNLSSFKEDNQLPDIIGAENHCFYIKADLADKGIEDYVAELIRLKAQIEHHHQKDQVQSIDDVDQYLAHIGKMEYEYL